MRAFVPFARRIFVALFLTLTPLAAAGAQTPDEQAAVAADIAPGRFVWKAEAASEGPVRVLVSIPLQMAFVYRGDALVGVSSVSTGQPGYDTPTGTFTILEKDKDHKSNIYDSAPMPYMLRLTWDGVALHAGHVTGQPASHGCVRLPAAFAKKLFEITPKGATVTVVDEVPEFMQTAELQGPASTETASR